MINYKKSSSEDIDALYPQFEANIRKFFKDEYGPKTMDYFFRERISAEEIKQMIGNGGSFYIAEDGDKAVGFLLIMEREMGGTSFANWFAVNEEYQNQGIGSSLLKLWEEDSLKKGIHVIWLGTEKHNLDFYKKRGFTYMGTMPKGYWGAEDNYVYKTIQEPNEDAYIQ